MVNGVTSPGMELGFLFANLAPVPRRVCPSGDGMFSAIPCLFGGIDRPLFVPPSPLIGSILS